MMVAVEALETSRQDLQQRLDASKGQAERNRLGQFATPPALALDILVHARSLLPEGSVRFLDPAFGTGSFYSALLRTLPENMIARAAGFEVDRSVAEVARRLWAATGLQLEALDFTRAERSLEATGATLLICNPPYVRHHHLSRAEKQRLQGLALRVAGVKPSGLSGLYCYFLLLSDPWMAPGCLAGWLIPSEFMDVNYGKAVKAYLLDRVTLLRIHRFDPADMQFTDALVSSAVVWFKKAPPPSEHAVEFTYGGTLSKPAYSRRVPLSELRRAPKWSRLPSAAHLGCETEGRLGDLFQVKRGVATGANDFFILTEEEAQRRRLPKRFLVPVLPSPRFLEVQEVQADERGFPVLPERRVLLSCDLAETIMRRDFPALAEYLDEGKRNGVHERYLCRHRKPWFLQEKRPPAPILCTYMGRGSAEDPRPFRFILNHSQATATNVYLMLYPKPALAAPLRADPTLLRRVWAGLANVGAEALKCEGRVYGGGLHKMEPRELANISSQPVLDMLPRSRRPRTQSRLHEA